MAIPSLAFWCASSSDDGGYGTLSGGRQSPDEGTLPAGIDRFLGLSNAEIVSGIAAGDVELFRRLFNAYATSLARWAYLTTRSGELAEDVVAEIFAHVWEHRSTWVVHRTVEAYLFGAVRARTREMRRIDHRRAELLNRHSGEEPGEIPGHGSPDTGPDLVMERRERQAQLLIALQTLPIRQREAIVARWYQGMSYEEVGAVLGISALAARQLVFRALTLLRTRLRESSIEDF